MSEELRECPHCGATRGLYTLDEYGGLCVDDDLIAQIFCDNCKSAFENENADNGKELIEAWNTRAKRTCHPFSGIVLGGPECREEKVWRCSECEEVLSWDYEGYDPETDGPAYCEHCGSKVTGPKVVS